MCKKKLFKDESCRWDLEENCFVFVEVIVVYLV